MPTREVPCPSCRQPALFEPSNPWRPFCSARCRGVDLGAWASEQYRLAAQTSADDLDSEGPAPQPPAAH